MIFHAVLLFWEISFENNNSNNDFGLCSSITNFTVGVQIFYDFVKHIIVKDYSRILVLIDSYLSIYSLNIISDWLFCGIFFFIFTLVLYTNDMLFLLRKH